MADTLSLLKDFLQSIKKYNDVELMHKGMELQMAVFDQQQENVNLGQELATAREQLAFRNKLRLKQFGETNYYVIEGEDIPYCSVCYGKNQVLIPLGTASVRIGGFGRECQNCKNLFVEDTSRRASMTLRPERR